MDARIKSAQDDLGGDVSVDNPLLLQESFPGQPCARGGGEGEGHRLFLQPRYISLTETELARAGRAPHVVAAKNLVPSRETRDIHRAGGRQARATKEPRDTPRPTLSPLAGAR